MAVQDKYVNTNLAADKLSSPLFGGGIGGAQTFTLVGTEEIAAADDNASVYRFFKNLNPNLVPIDILVFNDAITAGTDYDIGLYETGVGGAAVDADCFLDGGDLSSGHALGSALSGISAVDPANVQKTLYEHGGHTIATRKAGYDVCLTANTVGSAAGTVSIQMTLAQP